MYLKALEIQGFKSFPEKTSLTFEKDITAIVGPNGSGKSNISDAIRWVMGEQSSRSLRGGKMEDVIFGGTELRKQVGFAQVSLIIDNTNRIFDMDNTEVMITRRYYRSGESEYYINRETVRLKDIHEMLMDTGMGREGYAIIDQGRTSEILSIKSVDRRDIFEEAAGISRFRHRKEESERKLAKTDENLTRINDKIAELELQVGPLREQSEIAKRYLILRDEFRGLEISLWLENLKRLSTEAIKLSAEHEQAKERLEKSHNELEELYHSAETFSQRMQEKNLMDEQVRAEISGAQSQVSELENQSAVLYANLKSNTETIDRMTADLSQQEDRTDAISTQIRERRNRLEQIETEMQGWSEKRQGLDDQISLIARDLGEKSDELEALMSAQSSQSMVMAEKKEKLSALAGAVQELYDRDDSLTSDMANAKERAEQTQNQLGEISGELEKTEAEAGDLSNIIQGHMLRLKARGDMVQKKRRLVTDLTLKHGSIKSRVKLLTDMEREYEGYSKAVKTIMREAGRGILKNVHGPVANLLTAEDTYALAVETALGAAGQNIIVGMPEDGKSAIQFLKRAAAGRATFLPISTIKAHELRERGLESCSGFVGIAADLVSYEDKYENIYRNLLGRTVVVHNIDDAIDISKQYGYRFRIVTLDGQVISTGGSMSGGSAARNTGILSRANEIKELSQEEKRLSSQLRKNQDELHEADLALKSETGELDRGKNELRQLEDAVLHLRANKTSASSRAGDAIASALALTQELDGVKRRIDASTQEMNKLKSDISNQEQVVSRYASMASEITKGNEDMSTRREDITGRLNTIQASIASLEAEQAAAEQSIEELTSLSMGLSGDRDERKSSIESIKARNQVILSEIADKKSVLVGLEEKISGLRERLSVIGTQKLEMEAQRTRADKETQDKNRRILDMERTCSRIEQKKLASEMEEKQIVDKLWESYELTVTAAEDASRPIENVSEATRDAAKLKRDIGALGTPNIGAIGEFERVNTRYTFLTEQKDDIQKAKTELEEIIGDITGEMKEIFAKEFQAIAAEFKETFTELFGGGKASLELEDEDDILNCGIEIKAQPPGKSLKTITLLSGGEKAFTAIALYFAIQKIRPTPFCVMDEIEAALDEANILRFAEYMRRLSGKTQFIAITHRRGTMEEADMLYGVTMQEHGVSKILHVDVEEAERTINKK